MIVLAGITAFFFLFSNLKVGHISGISIAFGFWQVLSMFSRYSSIKWPGELNGSLTAASITNFNFDFLSAECIFVGISYETKWTLQTFLPVIVLTMFVILYVGAEIRSFIASRVARSIQVEYLLLTTVDESTLPSSKVKQLAMKLNVLIMNGLRWCRNFAVWYVQEPCTRPQLKIFLNKCINSYCTFLSFCFSFLMTNNADLFTCNLQSNGQFTLNSSSDITCFADSRWYTMFPFAIISFVFLNIGSCLFYLYMIIKMEDITRPGSTFRHRFKFVLQRFKLKYFFWDAVITLRKTIISLLNIFFKPMTAISLAIATIFAGLLLQERHVSFKRKFHNIMEYFILLCTMIVLICGLLFYVNAFPTEEFKVFVRIVAFVVIIGSTIAVFGMILWDANTRKTHEKRKRKLQPLRVVK